METQTNELKVVGEVLSIEGKTIGSGARMCKVKIVNIYGEKDGKPLRTTFFLTAWRDMADFCESGLEVGDEAEFFCKVYRSKDKRRDVWYDNHDILNVGEIKKAGDTKKTDGPEKVTDEDLPF